MSQYQLNMIIFVAVIYAPVLSIYRAPAQKCQKMIRSLLFLRLPTPNFGEFMVINPSKLKIQFKRDFCYQHPVYALKTRQMGNQSSLKRQCPLCLKIMNRVCLLIIYNSKPNPENNVFSIHDKVTQPPYAMSPLVYHDTIPHHTHTTLDQSPQGSTRRQGGLD